MTDGPLTEGELRLMRRLFSDPTQFPAALTSWLRGRAEVDPPLLMASSVSGLPDSLAGIPPIGATLDYPGSGDPSASWLIADGRSLARASYPTLFKNLGGVSSPWGLPDGTHFNIPDYRGRGSVGAGTGPGLTNRVLGTVGGEETHQLTTPELAVHTHAQDPHAHGPVSGALFAITSFIAQVAAGASFAAVNAADGATAAATATNQNAGSGVAHNNMQPWVAANKIIRVL